MVRYNSFMDTSVHNVAELSAATRVVVESLIGHPLADDQKVIIAALSPTEQTASEKRQAAWRELQPLLDTMGENARQSGLSSEEIDRLIDEACESVRYGD